jgi:DHA1 family tetracycline resistance protein-like MFS transporter
MELFRKLLPILGITFVDILGFSMLIPVLPYFVIHFKVAPWFVGVLFSTFSLCQFLSGPIWGNVSDRVGRKAVLIISQIGATIGWTMLAFAPTITWVFIARIVEGVSGGNIGITQAYVADIAEAKDRSRAFGLIGATFAAAMTFGPFTAGRIYATWGFSAPFIAAAALQLLTLLLTIFLLPESRKASSDDQRVGFADIIRTARDRALRPILVQKLALSLTLYGWYSVIALFLAGQLKFGLVQTTTYFSLFAIINVAINGFGIGAASKRFGDRAMSNIGLASLLASFLIVPLVHSPLLFVVTMILFAVGGAYANTGITALLSNAYPDREQGTVLSIGSSLDSIAGIASPPVSTGLLSRFGPSFAGVDSAFFAAIALGLGLIAVAVGAPVSRKAAEAPAAPGAPVIDDVM